MLNRKLLWAALLLVPLIGACTQPVGEGHIEVDPEALDFGAVRPGSSATRAVSMRNTGTETVRLRELKLAGAQADQFSLESPFTEIELPAGQATAVAVSFRPTKGEAATAELSLLAGLEPRTIGLRGFGADQPQGPRIAHWFVGSSVFTPAEATKQLRIANVGSERLRLAKPDSSGGSPEAALELVGDHRSEFVLAWPPEEYPAAGLAPGESVGAQVEFRPKSAGAKAAVLRIYSNDLERPASDVELRGSTESELGCRLEMIPEQLVYDAGGSPKTQEARLRNLPDSPADLCIVRGVRLEEGSSQAFALDKEMGWAAIKRGEALAVPVRFTPDGQEHEGSVRFEIDDPQGSTISVPVRALEVRMMIAPSELDFGTIALGCTSRVRWFTVYSVSRVPVRIESAAIVGSGAFRLARASLLPMVLAPGDQMEVGIEFRPHRVGEDVASLQVIAPQSKLPFVAKLTARTVAREPVTDVFVQNHAPKLDVLFVIDDSPSMADKQQALGRNLEEMFDDWDRSCIDYQVAFTTTAVDAAHGGAGSGADYANGRFLPLDGSRPRIVSSAMPDRRALLRQNAAVGTSGTALEFLLRPATLALTNPLSASENAGFLRPGASLDILVISDSADHETSPVADYAAFLMGLRRSAHFAAVVPTRPEPPAGCSYGEPDAGASTRARDLAALTGGGVADICDADWADWFRVSGFDSCPRRHFSLSNLPFAPEWIRVGIDGVPFARSGADGKIRWRYNAETNSVEFELGSVPPPGATVVIAYEPECR